MTPSQIVIFGASGDLTRRKLIPALVRNHAVGAFKGPVQVIGVSRSKKSHQSWRTELGEALDDSLQGPWAELASDVYYVPTDASVPEQLHTLHETLDDLAGGPCGRLFYLALRPDLFAPVVEALHGEGLLRCPPHDTEVFRRVVIEKPFGRDLQSARALNDQLLTFLREDQIFRIDHYLGKETVQNLLSFRFQNAIFEPLWNRKHIESVEISVCETVAMESGRGHYYDTAGALRDMVQNHVLQVFSLVAMEPPGSLSADAVRSEKVKAISALRPFSPEEVSRHVVRGQYTSGPGRQVGYLAEQGVHSDSRTETYVAIRALVDNWRWSGVPFLLRTGKALNRRYTEVVLRFRTPPVDLLNGPVPGDVCALRPNALRIQIQPQEGVRLGFLVKQPGAGMVMRPAELGFDYDELDAGETPPAYQRLLLDALEGNPTLFIRGDEVEASWAFVDRIRAGWDEVGPPLHGYSAGSWGPEAADALFHGCEGTWGA